MYVCVVLFLSLLRFCRAVIPTLFLFPSPKRRTRTQTDPVLMDWLTSLGPFTHEDKRMVEHWRQFRAGGSAEAARQRFEVRRWCVYAVRQRFEVIDFRFERGEGGMKTKKYWGSSKERRHTDVLTRTPNHRTTHKLMKN